MRKDKPGKRKIDNLPLSPAGEIVPVRRPSHSKRYSAMTQPPKGPAVRRADLIIAALLGGNTIKRAAAIAQTTRETVQNYMASPWFEERFVAAKKNLLNETIANLRGFATGAVQGLNEILVDRTAPPLARVSAGREILGAMLRAVELEDVVGQLEELKRAVAESKENRL